MPFSEWRLTTCAMRKPEFSEQLPERSPELIGTHMEDFICPCILGALFQELEWSPRARILVTFCLSFLRFDLKKHALKGEGLETSSEYICEVLESSETF